MFLTMEDLIDEITRLRREPGHDEEIKRLLEVLDLVSENNLLM